MLTLRRAASAVILVATWSGCRGKGFEQQKGGEFPDGAVDSSAAQPPFDAQAPADEAVPSEAADEFEARARHLLEAIATDDPDRATDVLFPREGWIAARDSIEPGKDWSQHVAAPFRKAIHTLSRRHAALGAQFVSLEIGHSMQQQTLRKHGWRKPLWSAHGSRLTFVVDGHTRVLSIREMTAWRGAWYVTRLR